MIKTQSTKVDLLIARYEKKASHIGRYKMFDTIYGANVFIDELMYFIIKYFVKDRYKSIVDPTCGTENYQFNKLVDILKYWGIEYKPCDFRPDNWACKNNYSNCVCNVFKKDTLPEGEVWIYDPPFLPHGSVENRHNEYLIFDQGVAGVKRYYRKEVFKNFIEKGAKLIIVKGADFYYPKDSDNLYLFVDIVPRNELNDLKLVAYIKYRYMHYNTPLLNYRIRNFGDLRLHIVTTYYLVFKVI